MAIARRLAASSKTFLFERHPRGHAVLVVYTDMSGIIRRQLAAKAIHRDKRVGTHAR
jgi:hypothetical protein